MRKLDAYDVFFGIAACPSRESSRPVGLGVTEPCLRGLAKILRNKSSNLKLSKTCFSGLLLYHGSQSITYNAEHQ